MQKRRTKHLTATVPPRRHTFRFEIFGRGISKRDKQIDQGTYHPKRSPSYISAQRHGPHEPAVRSTTAASKHTAAKVKASADSGIASRDIRYERGPPSPKRAGDDINLRTTTECDVNSTVKRKQRALRAIEEDLIEESQSKLDPSMVDIRPHPSLSSGDREAIEKIYQSLLKEIRDKTTEIGRIWHGIASYRPDAKEKPLSDLFVRLKMIIGQRIAAECHMPIKQAAQPFNSLGNVDMRDGDVPDANESSTFDKKLDILVHGNASELDDDVHWAHILTFGEVKSSSAADLRNFLVGQILRYERKLKQYHSITGRSYFFTLCGPILRLWYTDPVRVGTSAGYSFKNINDFRKIFYIIAFFCGPERYISEQWEPRNEEIIHVQNETRRHLPPYQYRLTEVKRLAVSATIWGRRTAAWSAKAVPLSESYPAPPENSMHMVIKSTWLPCHLHQHELNVLSRIDDNRSETNKHLHIPIPIGKIVSGEKSRNRSQKPGFSGMDIDRWFTKDQGWRNSTFATFCVPGTHIRCGQPVGDERQLLRLYRGFFEIIRFLASIGVHYRDLNNGNIMRAADGECLVIDFGNARILKQRRGAHSNLRRESFGNDLDISLDDSRSGTRKFLCRRIHKLAHDAEVHHRITETLEVEKKNPANRARAALTANIVANSSVKLAQRHRHHRYIDDAESAVYLMLYQASSEASLEESLEDLYMKQTLWEIEIWDIAKKSLPLIDWTIWSLKELIDKCQLGLEAVEPNAEGLVDPAETECFDKCITAMMEREKEIDLEREAEDDVQREAENLAAMSLGPGCEPKPSTAGRRSTVRGRRHKRAAHGKTKSQG